MLSLFCSCEGEHMKEIKFFENSEGSSDLWDFLEELRIKSYKSKDCHIQYKQIIFYIELLRINGTNLPNTIVRHLEEDIYELRPGNNRVLFFYFKDNIYVLLHHFKKKTQKTPTSEIAKAKIERNKYVKREGN